MTSIFNVEFLNILLSNLASIFFFLNVFRDSRILLEQVGVGGQSRETGLSDTKRSAQKYTCVPQTTFFCTNERWCYLQTVCYSHP